MSEGSLTSVETRQNLSRLIPPEIADILGPPPLLSTENRQAYDALLTQLVLEWKPRNIIGWTFVDDLANISLEIFRHRRAIANLFAISFKTALRAVLTDVLPEEGCKPWFDHYDTVKGLAQAWFEGPQEQEKVKSELAKYGLTAEAIVAQTYVLRRDELHELHRLLAVAEARRIGCCAGAEFCVISAWLLHGVRQANRCKSPQCDAEYRSAHKVGKSALPRKFSASRPFVQSARRPGACRGNGPTG
jgi:hypothetical protein